VKKCEYISNLYQFIDLLELSEKIKSVKKEADNLRKKLQTYQDRFGELNND
jgi:uncharacterized coiled-coil DUF342 family protein